MIDFTFFNLAFIKNIFDDLFVYTVLDILCVTTKIYIIYFIVLLVYMVENIFYSN